MPQPPHLPPLPSDYEREPARLHHLFSDFPGDIASTHVRYFVKTGDTLENIAYRCNVTSHALLDECFGTRDPREVNWYLRTKVGCKELGPQGKNYKFTSDADPGAIFLPNRLYQTLSDNTVKPVIRPFRIHGRLPRYTQGVNGCWGAAVANLYDYNLGQSGRAVVDVLREFDPAAAEKYVDEASIDGPEASRIFRNARLKPLSLEKIFGPEHYTDEDRFTALNQDSLLADFIFANAPFAMLQYAYGNWTHWVLIVGYKIDAGTFRVIYFDPGKGYDVSWVPWKMYQSLIKAPSNYPKIYG